MPRTLDLYSRWSREMRRSGFFHAGERIGVAVSGGPDSTLLAFFIQQLARETGFKPAAVHFNHRLRGSDSDADEQFSHGLADRLGMEWYRSEADVAKVAREKHRNLEATARHLRYKYFYSLISPKRLDKIVTAHTANDQAETVLLKLLRGAGTRGLAGIYPSLEGKVIRPFLNVTRAEVEEELRKRDLESRVDSSNADTHFQRNKIRKELIPLLQREFNPEVVNLLKDTSDRARDDEAFLEEQAHERARPWRVREGKEDRIPAAFLNELPRALSRRVLRQMMLAVRGDLRGITYRHIEALRQFAAEAQSGRKILLPGGCEARREFEWLILAPPSMADGATDYSFPIKVPGEVFIPALGLTFQFNFLGTEGAPKAYNALGAGGFVLPESKGELVLRNWRPGDRFGATNRQKARSMKGLFVRLKVPVGQRKTWPVLACGDHLIWAKDCPNDHPKVTPSAERRVLVTLAGSSSAR